MAKLLEFRLNDDERIFSIYGKYTIEEAKRLNLSTYKYPEFDELEAKQVTNGELSLFEPEGESWDGHKYDVEDIMSDVILHSLVGSSRYEIIYLEEGLKKFIKAYTDNTVTTGNMCFAKEILSHDLYDIFELLLVTDEYAYYGSCDQFLMIGTESREIVSDNYFAEVGFDDSVENVRNGKESLLWGELPEEEEK